jgi:hypothetical protein
LNTVAQGFSILLFYTICTFCSQTRPNAAKAETNKTIVDIGRISGCTPEPNIAKSGFYNFESGAFNHSATLPRKPLLKTHCAAFRANTLCVRLRQGQAHSPVAFGGGARDSRGPDAGRIGLPLTLTLPK